MLHKIIKGVAPVAAVVLSMGLVACDGVNIEINDSKGVPLSELDLAGKTPGGIVLAGPDDVVVTDGDKLAITVEGEAADHVRFTLDDDALGIMREKGNWSDKGKAIVRVTMPTPHEITIAGSGTVTAQSLKASPKGKTGVTIAGSGDAKVATIDADTLDLTIAGSGTFTGAGAAKSLKLTVAGSGTAATEGLKVEKAEVTVAGSGSAAFASDGKVEANIMGSGEVKVAGNATCTVKSMGSGKLTCTGGTSATAADAAPDAPQAPEAPETPPAPEAPGTGD
ncbi:MAG: DUF2807 domain-containing protein [Sphingomonadales bacterium]|nr:DUF2807 domain-containing protein [Sphingomonadales bacterium]MBD3774422.1 DUF2807 domain-containing protein [Paracoccaceae bacterium]